MSVLDQPVKVTKEALLKQPSVSPVILNQLHQQSYKNELLIKEATDSGCFSCLSVSNVPKKQDYEHIVDGTVLCPFCKAETLIPFDDDLSFDANLKQLVDMQRHYITER